MRKRVGLVLSGLCLIGLFGAMGLHAGDMMSTLESTLAPPPLPNPPLNVAEANKDGNGNIRVHEQGTVRVEGTVNVGNAPSVQDVRVVNGGRGSIKIFDEVVQQLEEDLELDFDIGDFSSVRIFTGVNGVGTGHFVFSTDAGIFEVLDVNPGYIESTVLTDTPGTKLTLRVSSADTPQIVLRVFGSK